MMQTLIALLVSFFFSTAALAAGDTIKMKQQNWPFDGIFGTVEQQSAQRGYQVYKEVCAACHGLKRIAYRNLQEIGFSEAEAKALAAEATIEDGPNDDGDMFDRPGRASDYIPSPFPNEKAARASNGGAYPLDLSLIVKARPDGANYLYSLLTGYEAAPEGVELGEGMHYNRYFAGNQIAMPNPLSDGLLDYQDGTEASVEQMAKDITNFLQWTAEPEMQQRKRMGVKVFLYLIIFTLLFYLAKCRIWANVK